MADTKVSGLTGAASLLSTHEFPVNEAGTSKKVTGAQITAAVAKGTTGSAYYVAVTANQTPVTTVWTDLTSLTLTISAAVANGRRFRITAQVNLASTVVNDISALAVFEGATQLTQANCSSPVANAGVPATAIVILTPSNASHTYKLSAGRASGTGVITMQASATIPAFMLIEDIGT